MTPNIVIVIADDLAWADVGYNGQKHFETPHIDQLAADGMRFNHAYSGASVCSPSRACLISGMYSPRHSIFHPGNRARGKLEYMKLAVPNRVVKNETYDWFSAIGDLAPDVNSLAKVLKPAGYVSARYGKWHVGRDEQGFDISMDVRNGWRDKDSAKKLTDGGIKFMREHEDRPFFLYLPHAMPGSDRAPFACEAFRGKSANGLYGDSVEEIDWSTGEILRALKQLDLDTRTLVIWTSDNGAYLNRGGSNAPLRGGLHDTTEGGFRMPCIAWWPGQIPEGTSSDEVTTMMDLLPTFARLAGAELGPEPRLLGAHPSGTRIRRSLALHAAARLLQGHAEVVVATHLDAQHVEVGLLLAEVLLLGTRFRKLP